MHNATNSSTPLRLTVRGAQKVVILPLLQIGLCVSLHPDFNGGGGARRAKVEDTFVGLRYLYDLKLQLKSNLQQL